MSQQLHDLINELSTIRDKEVVSAYIPSLKTTQKFLPLNMKQQKQLLKASMDGPLGLIEFNKILLEIVVENSIDTDVEYNSVDRYAILLALRAVCLGSTVNIEDKSYDLASLPAANSIALCDLTSTIKYKNISVDLECPSLKKDLEFIKTGLFDLKKVKDLSVNESITTLYVLELIKFIQSLELNGAKINFDDLSTGDKKQIVDNLPVALIQSIQKYITQVREVENQFITFNDGAAVQINTLFFSAD